LVICWIDLVFSQAIWSTSVVNRAIRAEISDALSLPSGCDDASFRLLMRSIAATIGLVPLWLVPICPDRRRRARR